MARARLPETNEEAWEAAGAWGTSGEMSPFEALMWRAESDPRLRAPMTLVDLLDEAPDWDRLVAAHDWGTRLVPRARQRVVDPPHRCGRSTPTSSSITTSAAPGSRRLARSPGSSRSPRRRR